MQMEDTFKSLYDTLYGGPQNLSTGERVGSVVLGLAAIGTALKRRPLAGALLAAGGLALVGRGMSGRCAAKAALTGEGRREGSGGQLLRDERPARASVPEYA